MPGETLGGYLERTGIAQLIRRRPVLVTINGLRVPRSIWQHCRPKPGTLIQVQALVHGGGGGKNPIAGILSIALLFVAPQLGAALGQAIGLTGTAFSIGAQAVTWGALLGGAVTIVGNIAINALFPPPKPQISQLQSLGARESPTYSLSGGSNRMRPYEPMPVIMGVHRVFPDAGARTYTEFEGEDQYLYQVFDFGYNDVDLSDFKIGATPLANYAGVTLEESGASGALALFPTNVDTAAGAALTQAAGWISRTSSPGAVSIAIEIEGQLFEVLNSGLGNRSVIIEIQYRAVGAPDWTPLEFVSDAEPEIVTPVNPFNFGGVKVPEDELEATTAGLNPGEVKIINGTRKPVRRRYFFMVASGQYEIRVRRISVDDTDSRLVSDLIWTQLRTYQPDTADYTGRKRIALKIKASGQLNGVVAQFSAIARAKTLAWNGAAWVTAQTSNPAWWLLAAARGKYVNNRRMWGAGIADARIGLENIKAFGAWCDAQGLTFNGVFDQQLSVYDMMAAIALTGRGTVSSGAGRIEAVWDAPGQPAVAVFSMSNIKLDSFEIEYVTEQLADEVVLSFTNPEIDWQRDVVRVLAPGVTDPVRSRNIELFGCTNKDLAGRAANLYIATNVYRTKRYRWQMDWEGMPVSRGEAGYLSHDLASYDYSGRLIEGSTASQLRLERKVPLNAAGGFVTLVKPDGSFATHAVQGGVGDSSTLDLVTPLAFNPGADPEHPPYDYRWLYGHTATPGKKVKVDGIAPRGHDTVSLTAVDEVPEYYASETNPYIHVPLRAVFGNPEISNLQLTEDGVRAATGYMVKVSATWDAGADYGFAEVRVSIDGGPLTLISGEIRGRSFEFTIKDGAQLLVELTGYSSLGRLGKSVKITATKTVNYAALFPPAEVQNFSIAGKTFSWRESPEVDVMGYHIRFHYGSTRRTWGDATPLLEGLITEIPWEPIAIPSGPVVFLICAVDAAGLESVTPGVIVTDLGDPDVVNVLESFDLKMLGFPGTIIDGTLSGGNLEADDASGLFWGDDSKPFWGADGDLFWPVNVYKQMTYEATVSPTAADGDSTMTIEHNIAGNPFLIEYRRQGPTLFWDGDDGDLFWGADDDLFWPEPPGYIAWPGSIMANNELYDIRITTGAGATKGVISELTVNIDVPDIEESFDDIAISSSGTRLPITKTYRAITNVQATVQSDGNGAVSVRIEDKDAVLGPLLRTINDTAVAVNGLIDARIKGY